jgi:hypothetical protein
LLHINPWHLKGCPSKVRSSWQTSFFSLLSIKSRQIVDILLIRWHPPTGPLAPTWSSAPHPTWAPRRKTRWGRHSTQRGCGCCQRTWRSRWSRGWEQTTGWGQAHSVVCKVDGQQNLILFFLHLDFHFPLGAIYVVFWTLNDVFGPSWLTDVY